MTDAKRDAVGRAAHEAWKGWIIQGGYADHALVKRVVGSTANGDDRYVCATCADSRGMSGHGVGYAEPSHHPDMVPWDDLSEEKRGKYLATGMAGYAAAEAEIASLKAELDQNRYERHLLANGIDQWQSRAEQARTENAALRARVEALGSMEGERDVLRAALAKLEWAGTTGFTHGPLFSCCPVCGVYQETGSHYHGCWLAAVLEAGGTAAQESAASVCATCNGSGALSGVRHPHHFGEPVCPKCGGTGKSAQSVDDFKEQIEKVSRDVQNAVKGEAESAGALTLSREEASLVLESWRSFTVHASVLRARIAAWLKDA